MRESAKNIIYIISALCIAFIPLVLVVPFWISAWCFMLWGYLICSQYYKVPLPGRSLRVLLALVGVLAIIVTSASIRGGSGYISLLAIMAGLKPYEMNSHRDRMITLFIAYFIVITSLFRIESLVMTLFMFPAVFYITAIIIRINQSLEKTSKDFGLSFRIMLQAFPLVIVLFLFFPRFSGSLWGIFEHQSGSTGFSETLSPGDITAIVKNDEIAFRAEFDSTVPDHSLLYWRGVTFNYFDGRSWKIDASPARRPEAVSFQGQSVAYSIILEPHGSRYLFALDMPVSAVIGAEMMGDYTFRSFYFVRRRFHYSLSSSLDYRAGVKVRHLERYLQLPKDGNEKTRALAERLRLTSDGTNQLIDRALSLYVENTFQYTLSPPRLGTDSVDDFLFKTQKGYCEHYASSFAFLLRAAGIPCRVIGGYQGGEASLYGKYVLVRQSDAHAWTEVWLENTGWVRIDPTFAVSPQRVTQGVREALSSEELFAFFKERGKGILGSLSGKIALRWELINSWWDFRFSGYDFIEQRFLLQALGIEWERGRGFLIFFIISMVFFFFFVSLFFMYKKRYHPAKGDRIQEIYFKFCKKVQKMGINRRPSQGPDDFKKEIVSARSDLTVQTDNILDLYIQLRYGYGSDKESLVRFHELVKQFKAQ